VRVAPSTRVLLLADTHLGADQASRLLDALAGRQSAARAILHAGDVTDASVLGVLEQYAPVFAVLGNNDRTMSLPERLDVDIDGCRFAMVHDSGESAGRGPRLRRWFPDADVVVFGHSHMPWWQTDIRPSDGHVQHHVNPGSAMQRRRAPRRTVAWIEITGGAVTSVEHDPLTD